MEIIHSIDVNVKKILTQTHSVKDPVFGLSVVFSKNKCNIIFTFLCRRVIWEKNVRKVQQHNLEFDMGRHTFSMGINEYSDLVSYISLKYEVDFELFKHIFSQVNVFIPLNLSDMG